MAEISPSMTGMLSGRLDVRRIAELGGFLSLLALSRVAMMWMVSGFVGGREFTDDPDMHLDMASRPLELLLGVTETHGQHPVLLPIVEWLLLAPFRPWADTFESIRLSTIVCELLLFAVLGVAVSGERARTRLWILGALLLSPMGWMMSAVMPQDEIIGAVFLAMGMVLATTGRERPALVVLGIGVAAAKIFLAIPLIALIALGRSGTTGQRAVLGLVPALVPYLISAAFAVQAGSPPPLGGFTPDADFGVNVWVWFVGPEAIPAAVAKPASALLAGVAALAPIALAWRARAAGRAFSIPAVFASSLLGAFLLFYHVNPEYFVLVLVGAVPLLKRPVEILALHVVMAAPWAVNFFYGVATAKAAGTGRGKQAFVSIYERVFPFEPTTLQHLAVALTTIGLAMLLAVLVGRITEPRRT